jgi:hypothetical protein
MHQDDLVRLWAHDPDPGGGGPRHGPWLNRTEAARRLRARCRVSTTESYDGTACLLWTGFVDGDGYGNRLQVEGVVTSPHRMSYWAAFGAIPDGLQIDHRCHDPWSCSSEATCPHRRCINPLHLEAVTPQVNTLRSGGVAAANAAASKCSNGHPWDKVHATGRRRCSTCEQELAREQYRRRSAPDRDRVNDRRRLLDADSARRVRRNRAALLAKRGLRPEECLNGHRYIEGSFRVGPSGKRICLVCWRGRRTGRPAVQS